LKLVSVQPGCGFILIIIIIIITIIIIVIYLKQKPINIKKNNEQ